MVKSWEEATLRYYYQGLTWGEYPRRIMERLADAAKGCCSLLDICSGPGAFALYGLQQGWETTAVDLSPTALAALKQQALRYPQACFRSIYGDFLEIPLQRADLAVAACCFYEQMASRAALDKIIASARQLALFVQHDDFHQPEFLARLLPAEQWQAPQRKNNYPIEEQLLSLTAERGLQLHQDRLECDFGCLYDPQDELLLEFVRRKSGIADRQLLRRHLQNIAITRDGQPWLPNPRLFRLFWISCR